MGKINRGSKGIHGDTVATSQSEADVSCPYFNYLPGILSGIQQIVSVGGSPIKGGGNPETLTLPNSLIVISEITSQPSTITRLS